MLFELYIALSSCLYCPLKKYIYQTSGWNGNLSYMEIPKWLHYRQPREDFHFNREVLDVVYTHSHKLYIILETASEEGSLNDIIALKTKKTHSSVDTVGVYCNICGRINDVSCFCQSLVQSSWLTISDCLVENNNANNCLYFIFW